MLHTDMPTHTDIGSLLAARTPGSVSIYLPTTPVTTEIGANRIELKNLANAALDQLRATGLDKRDIARIADELDDLVDDEAFWARQAYSLAVFATPDGIRTFRLPNRLSAIVEVSDRFHVKPLLRAVTFPQACFVLALAQGSVRLLGISADLPPDVVVVEGLPSDVASAVGKASITDRSPSGRLQGSEGQKVRMTQYARQIDGAIRPVLAGSELPLILAGVEPLVGIFRGVNSYPVLAATGISGNPETTPLGELASAARVVLDALYAADLAAVRERFEALRSPGRASTDIVDVARAATYGAVDTLLVDIDEVVPGRVDETTGAVTFGHADDAVDYGVVDEIARRAFLSGARVLAVRSEDIPRGRSVAAILRYAI
jgi:hypothetical protein